MESQAKSVNFDYLIVVISKVHCTLCLEDCSCRICKPSARLWDRNYCTCRARAQFSRRIFLFSFYDPNSI